MSTKERAAMPPGVSKHVAETLKVDAEAMGKRMELVHKKLAKSIFEAIQPAIEGHIMMYGTNFESGLQMAAWATDLNKYVIAALMEQGKLAKKIPGQPKEKDEQVGQYL